MKIEKEIEKILASIVLGIIMLLIGFIMGAKINIVKNFDNNQVDGLEKVNVEYVWHQSGNTQEIDGFYLEKGDTLVLLSDESYALMNIENNIYSFQPIDLGDWDYEVSNEKQLENIVKTYLSIKNTGKF